MRVLVAHPQELMADALACLLSCEGREMEVVARCVSGGETVEKASRLRPEVVVMAPAFSDMEGAEVIRAVRERDSGSAVLVVATAASGEFLWLLEAGATGYMSLECSPEQFIETVGKVAKGEIAVCGVDRNATGSPNGRQKVDAERLAALVQLTPREREVLEQLSRGFSNRQIAENLFVSEHTVRTHVQNLRSKLNVRSKFQAAMLVMQAGQAAQGMPGGFRL